MNAQTRAVIDVGTNTIKLIVARAGCSQIETLLECKAEHNARLGAGFYRQQKLQAKTMRAAADAVRELSLRASDYEPVSVRAIATSAVRDACNRDEFIALVEETTGLSLEVLSGKTEAEWIFRGVTSDPSVSTERLLILGFGGGSTAAVVSDSGRIYCHSFDLGAVRLMEMLRLDAFPTVNDQHRCQIYLSQVFTELIAPQLKCELSPNAADFTLVATGGAATSLARMKIHARNLSWTDEQSWWLSREEVSDMSNRLWRLSPGERKTIPGLSEGKHDVILPGTAILEAAIKYLGFTRVRVTRRGVRYGALLENNSESACSFDSPPYQKNERVTFS